MAQDAEHDAQDLRDPVINPAIGNGQAEDGFPTGGADQRSKTKQGSFPHPPLPLDPPLRSFHLRCISFRLEGSPATTCPPGPLVRKQVSLSLTLFFCPVVVILAGLLFYFSERVDDARMQTYQ